MSKIFGTDGIRGTANIYPMTSEIALALGRTIAYKARKKSNRPKIIVGKDTRLSCYMIEMAVVSGICSMGADALMTGPIPTAGIAYLTKDMRCDYGVMITASHNPFQDNGIKVFGPDGFKLSDEEEAELEKFILEKYTPDQLIPTNDFFYPSAEKVGKAIRLDDCQGRYITHVKSVFPEDLDLCGMRIALDCANGASYKIAPSVFKELGADVVVIGNHPDGLNINDGCGALHPNRLADEIIAYKNTTMKFDIGFAFDGDADRLVVIDENGDKVDGDVILALAHCIMQREAWKHHNHDIVITTMSNGALREFAESCGGEVYTTDVGDRYVIEKMRETGAMIGGEQSGHIIYGEHSTTGDGIIAALKLLAYMREWKKMVDEGATYIKHGPMSRYSKIINLYPQVLINVDVKEKTPIDEIPGLRNRIEDAYVAISKDGGRVIVRYSGTESKMRIMIEAKDKSLAEQWASKIADIVRKANF